MKNLVSLLRKESFGGTLNNAISGKRIYINHEEFCLVKKLGMLPDDLRIELKAGSNEVVINEPSVLPTYNFSAPDIVFFEITRACNLTCKHCLNNSGNRLLREFSDKQIIAVINDIYSTGVQEIRFTGGEPLVVPSIFKYIYKARNLGLRVSMGTNGVLIDSQVAKKLASAGLNIIIVSIDGMEKQHDHIRGKGSFKKAIMGIQSLLDVGISVRINTVAMRSNMEEIPYVVEYFFQRNIPIMIRRFIPSGRADDIKTEMLTEVDYAILRNKLQSFLSNKKEIVKGHYLKDDKVGVRIKLPFERHSCSAGHRSLVILSEGNVQTCGFLSSFGEPPIGNLKKERLASLWQRLIESNYINSLRSLLLNYNTNNGYPKTNCIAVALTSVKKLSI